MAFDAFLYFAVEGDDSRGGDTDAVAGVFNLQHRSAGPAAADRHRLAEVQRRREAVRAGLKLHLAAIRVGRLARRLGRALVMKPRRVARFL